MMKKILGFMFAFSTVLQATPFSTYITNLDINNLGAIAKDVQSGSDWDNVPIVETLLNGTSDRLISNMSMKKKVHFLQYLVAPDSNPHPVIDGMVATCKDASEKELLDAQGRYNSFKLDLGLIEREKYDLQFKIDELKRSKVLEKGSDEDTPSIDSGSRATTLKAGGRAALLSGIQGFKKDSLKKRAKKPKAKEKTIKKPMTMADQLKQRLAARNRGKKSASEKVAKPRKKTTKKSKSKKPMTLADQLKQKLASRNRGEKNKHEKVFESEKKPQSKKLSSLEKAMMERKEAKKRLLDSKLKIVSEARDVDTLRAMSDENLSKLLSEDILGMDEDGDDVNDDLSGYKEFSREYNDNLIEEIIKNAKAEQKRRETSIATEEAEIAIAADAEEVALAAQKEAEQKEIDRIAGLVAKIDVISDIEKATKKQLKEAKAILELDDLSRHARADEFGEKLKNINSELAKRDKAKAARIAAQKKAKLAAEKASASGESGQGLSDDEIASLQSITSSGLTKLVNSDDSKKAEKIAWLEKNINNFIFNINKAYKKYKKAHKKA